MPDTTSGRSDARAADRSRMITAGIVFVLSVASMSVGFSSALFTDTASLDANTFTTGSVDISTTPSTALLTASAMAPGDADEASLTVSNAGSLQMRYAIQRSADNTDTKGLRDVLRLRIATQAGGSCDFPYYGTDGTPAALTDDTEIYEGLGFPATATNTVGDASTGSQTGDRTLNGGANEVLCFSVVLPSGAGNSVQSATTTATFDFVAEQTANN